MKIGLRVETEYFPQAMEYLGVPTLPSKEVLTIEPLALVQASEDEDLHEATDWWLYVSSKKTWVRLQITCAFKDKLADDIALIRMNSRSFEHASLGGMKALERLYAVVTAALLEVFNYEKGEWV